MAEKHVLQAVWCTSLCNRRGAMCSINIDVMHELQEPLTTQLFPAVSSSAAGWERHPWRSGAGVARIIARL
jgi:hypothetical protein